MIDDASSTRVTTRIADPSPARPPARPRLVSRQIARLSAFKRAIIFIIVIIIVTRRRMLRRAIVTLARSSAVVASECHRARLASMRARAAMRARIAPASRSTHRGFSASRGATMARHARARERNATPDDAKMSAGSADAKKKALARVLDEIDSNFGAGAIMRLGEAGKAKVATFPSGAMTLDIALGGGLPRGRIVEVYGPESSGKTTLALHAMAEMQRIGGTVAMIDAEHAFDPEYSARLGLNIEDIIVCQPETGEMALEVVDTLVRSSAVDLIVVDSVAALVPRSEIEGEIGMVQVGAHARLMSQALRKINVNAAKAGTTIIFLNQLRSKVGVIYGSPEVTTGGNALKYYASVRLDIRRKEVIKGKSSGEDDTGVRCKVKVAKNKVAPPYKTAEFDMMFGRGISQDGCLLDAGEQVGAIERRGAFYYYNGEKLGQGREKTLAFLHENAATKASIEKDVRQKVAEKMAAGAGSFGSSKASDDEPDEEVFFGDDEEIVAEAR